MEFKIKTKKKEVSYDITELMNYTITNYKDREFFLTTLVRKNPDILHTHIIKIAYDIVKMPTKTVESTLKRLEQSKILESTKHGSRKNSVTTWNLKEYHMFPGSEENIWKYFNKILSKYEKKVLRYEKKLQKHRDKQQLYVQDRDIRKAERRSMHFSEHVYHRPAQYHSFHPSFGYYDLRRYLGRPYHRIQRFVRLRPRNRR